MRVPLSAICAATPTNVVLVEPKERAIPREHPDDLDPWDYEVESH